MKVVSKIEHYLKLSETHEILITEPHILISQNRRLFRWIQESISDYSHEGTYTPVGITEIVLFDYLCDLKLLKFEGKHKNYNIKNLKGLVEKLYEIEEFVKKFNSTFYDREFQLDLLEK